MEGESHITGEGTLSAGPDRTRQLSQLTPREEKGPCLAFRSGPFVIHLTCNYPPLWQLLKRLYPESEIINPPTIADIHVRIIRPLGLRRWWRPQIQFEIDGERPFEPFPLEQALPMLEWGTNYCIALRAHHYLMLHSGAVERNGRAMIFPAMPGSGKSTLSTALSFRGWRLLSDEFGLVQPDGMIHPLPRAIPLKNQSIQIIRDFAPDAIFGPEFHGTRKGTVAHVRPSSDSLLRQTAPAKPAWIIFPHYRKNIDTQLEPIPHSLAFSRLAQNSFNYSLMAGDGFRRLGTLVRSCDCYSLDYSDLDKVINTLSQLQTPDESTD
ncbi:MAG: HprK-related kinase A [Gammaproteobacteria bacterium]|nr:HprK-related kinase A [Gammaproteobacteria bacterium]